MRPNYPPHQNQCTAFYRPQQCNLASQTEDEVVCRPTFHRTCTDNLLTHILISSSLHGQGSQPTDPNCSAIIAPMKWRYRSNKDGNLESFPLAPISNGRTSESFRGGKDLPNATASADHYQHYQILEYLLAFTCFGDVQDLCHRVLRQQKLCRLISKAKAVTECTFRNSSTPTPRPKDENPYRLKTLSRILKWP